jgi:hypothetical protein
MSERPSSEDAKYLLTTSIYKIIEVYKEDGSALLKSESHFTGTGMDQQTYGGWEQGEISPKMGGTFIGWAIAIVSTSNSPEGWIETWGDGSIRRIHIKM